MVSLTWSRLADHGPGWWPSLTEMAAEFDLPRATFYRALARLASAELIGMTSRRNMGIWIWWIQTRVGQRIDRSQAPVWVIRDVLAPRAAPVRVPIERMLTWGDRRGIPRKTLHNWMAGHQVRLRNRWEIVAGPHPTVVG